MRNVITTELTKLRRLALIKLSEKIINKSYGEIPKISKEIISEVGYQYDQDLYRIKVMLDESIKIFLGTDYSKTKALELYELLPEMEAVLSNQSQLCRKEKSGIINIIKEICDGCPLPQYYITDLCRNCSAKYCINSCPKKAISIVNGKPKINPELCVGCGLCAKNCPYGAILKTQRPCISACKLDAISSDEKGLVAIDESQCVQCGECAIACPFGAIVETSAIGQVIFSLINKKNIVAIFAPSSISQFGPRVTLGQFKRALKELGFTDAYEVALGADMVAEEEAEYLDENLENLRFITTSCCPAFKNMILKKFPHLNNHISPSLSPMNMLAKEIKDKDPNLKVVFIGPCIAKKWEADLYEYTDYVLTFEEIASIFAAFKIEPSKVDAELLDDATSAGRGFAASGGVTAAVKELAKKEFDCIVCNGMKECLDMLKTTEKGEIQGLIEGMGCEGGCISGPRVMINPRIALAQLKKQLQNS